MKECLGCASDADKCVRDGCPDCCYCGRSLRPDPWGRWKESPTWRARYGAADANFLGRFFDEQDREYEFMDNVRACRTDDEQGRAEYERRMECGCCGSVDTEIVAPSGATYMVGFNYGH